MLLRLAAHGFQVPVAHLYGRRLARDMFRHWFSLIATVIAAAYSAYAGVFFAWAGTAPAASEIHEQASALSTSWSGVFLISVLTAVWIIVRMIRISRLQRTQS